MLGCCLAVNRSLVFRTGITLRMWHRHNAVRRHCSFRTRVSHSDWPNYRQRCGFAAMATLDTRRHKHGFFFVTYVEGAVCLSPNIPSLARQRCLPSWGPRRTPWFFFVISQLFDAVEYSNYVFWVSETIIQ